ncbi:methyl-accepting chemotaxis protein [Vibrio quintilis]|uniref:Methyl-accepting chemotaxis protein PctC n=1 Tax=Vibrio quintilis TaxID=1117707 RepID=A0A1M7YWB5_9VIBR|nr:methyl-accepting chemotaxis protein [Vibrio quintilis]SHO56882.1 Methyl-accepting chemotaxis protein PctC [Vibrio quintilis]
MSLVKKLLIASCLIVSALAAIQAGISVYGIRTQISDNISSSNILYGASNAGSISEWLDEKKRILDAFTDALSRAETTAQITTQIKTIDKAGGFGSVLFGTVAGDTYRAKGLNTKAGYDPKIRPWYKNALNTDQVFLSEPYVGASSGKLIVTLSKKVMINGQLKGVAMASLPLDKINQDILSVTVPGNGIAFLLSSSGIIISHPDKALRNQPLDKLTSSIRAGELINNAAQKQLFELNVNQTGYLTNVTRVAGTNWYLVLMSQESVLLKPVQTMLIYQLVTAIVMIIISVIVLAVLMKYLLSGLQKVSAALNDIAQGEGDLTVNIEVKTQDEVGKLAGSFNVFVEKLHGIISSVNRLSEQILDQSEVTAESSEKRHQMVRHQQDEVVMVATAMTEMSTTTEDIAGNAEQTAHNAQQMVDITRTGNSLIEKSQTSINHLSDEVKNASHVIEELHQEGEKITKIVSEINDIAEQTNLLALNAAIEAARAGDQGRGFAVVADEVRNLSQRTRASTEEIGQMISSLQEKTTKAVDVMETCHNLASLSVEDTGSAATNFKHIESSINDVNNMAAQIATAAEEQAVTGKEINVNTESIREISEQLSEDSVEGTRQAGTLNEFSRKLIEQVNKFKI